jgi:hypothetical protein
MFQFKEESYTGNFTISQSMIHGNNAARPCFVQTSTDEQAFDRTRNAHLWIPPKLMDEQAQNTIPVPVPFSIEKQYNSGNLRSP